MAGVSKLTDAERALLDAAAPGDTLLPIEWWANFLSLFLNKRYSLQRARLVLDLYNAG